MIASTMAGVGLFAVPTAASAATAPITSSGPLTRVEISDVLNCAVDHTGDSAPEWYGDDACGTLLAVGGTLYGPDEIPAGGSASPRTTWTPVSQSAVTGSGSSANPYRVVTVVAAGTTGVRLTETDSYVVGQESYQVDVAVANTGSASTSAVLYRAGDCYLQDSDYGYGAYDAANGAISCTTDTAPGSRIEQMFPLTDGSSYIEDYYDAVWTAIGTQHPFPNTCRCSSQIDNGIGLSWNVTLSAGSTKTYSSLVTFSPVGRVPVTLDKTADASNVQPGAADGYTITLTNQNISAVTLSALTDTLGAGFTYVPGSSTGATTSDPSISGQTLTWSGITVPAKSSVTLHFGVHASATPGTYTDVADGTASGYTVVGTGATAPVTVACPPGTPAADVRKFADSASAAQLVSPSFTTTAAGELVVAYVEAGGPSGSAQSVGAVTGAGLSWTRAARSNAGTGTAEVWSARASGKLSNAAVTASLTRAGYAGSITVVSFRNAAGVGAVATTAGRGSAPAATVTAGATKSLIWAAGRSWGTGTAATPTTGQAILHQYVSGVSSNWTQFVSAPATAGHSTVVGDAKPVGDSWLLSAVEILPAASCTRS